MSAVALLIGLFEFGVIPHYKNGFYCNDPALSFPFKGDTLSMEIIVSTIILFPFALVSTIFYIVIIKSNKFLLFLPIFSTR